MNIIGKPPSTVDPFDLDSQYITRARSELNEGVNNEDKIKGLKILIKEQKKLESRMDLLFLVSFLRAKKYNVEKAFKMLKKFYEVRKKYSKFYELCLPGNKKYVYDLEGAYILPKYDRDGSGIFLCKLERYDPDIITVENMIQQISLLFQLMVQEPIVQISGIVIICDMQNFSIYQQLRLYGPTSIKVMIDLVQSTVPMRIKAIHVINEPWFFDAFYGLFRPFLKEKIKKRMNIHGDNLENLYKFVPLDLLPLEYGGTLDIDPIEYTTNLINASEQNIKDWYNYGFKD